MRTTRNLSLSTRQVVPFSNQGRIKQRKKRDGLRLNQLFPRYNGTLTPTAPMVVRLWEIFYLYSTKLCVISRWPTNVNICWANNICCQIFIFCIKRYFSYYLGAVWSGSAVCLENICPNPQNFYGSHVELSLQTGPHILALYSKKTRNCVIKQVY